MSVGIANAPCMTAEGRGESGLKSLLDEAYGELLSAASTLSGIVELMLGSSVCGEGKSKQPTGMINHAEINAELAHEVRAAAEAISCILNG